MWWNKLLGKFCNMSYQLYWVYRDSRFSTMVSSMIVGVNYRGFSKTHFLLKVISRIDLSNTSYFDEYLNLWIDSTIKSTDICSRHYWWNHNIIHNPVRSYHKNEQIRELILALAHFSKMQVLIEFKIFWEKFKQNNLPWQSTSVLNFKTNWPQHFAK